MAKAFRVIRVRSHDELERLLEHLITEAHRVHSHWQVWAAFKDSLEEYSAELNQTPNFWELTSQSYNDSIGLRLGRLFDPDPSVLSLGNLLRTIKENTSMLQVPIDIVELEQDMSRVSDDDPTIKSLLTWRNEYIAHRGSRHVLRGSFEALPNLELEALKAVLDRGLDLLQKYGLHLGLPWRMRSKYEEEDFKNLLALLRVGLHSRML